jgi:hypothetical protein
VEWVSCDETPFKDYAKKNSMTFFFDVCGVLKLKDRRMKQERFELNPGDEEEKINGIG